MSFFSKLLICLLLTLLTLLSPTQTFAQTLLLSDDFNDGNFDGWEVNSGNWSVNNGNLYGVEHTQNRLGEISRGSKEWDNYSVEFDINNEYGIDSALNFRRAANGTYAYSLRFGTGIYNTPEIILFKANNGNATILSNTHNTQLKNSNWYHVKVEVNGGNTKLWINNNKAIDYTDNTNIISKGDISFVYWTGDYGHAQVRIDNAKVTSLNPDPTPTPFLDLPWDYQGKGLSFNEAANSITSYFDHEYPLLSSGLGEPSEANISIISFLNPKRTNDNYSSHDGYDYGKMAKVNISDPILAAAAGTATYINSCGACGNMIVINHHNGFQTRYLHMQKDGLITSDPSQKVEVTTHQQIGKVGATGNVFPSGDAGAHIHFGVFQDKDGDGNFENNIPDGVTDPFGWQSKDPDPWENYTFFYAGKNRIGNKSFYLWKNKLDNLDATLTSNGGVFKTERSNFNFPANTTNQNLNLNIKSAPLVNASNFLQSIGSTLIATTTDPLGNLVKTFQNYFTLTIDFKNFDLSKFNLNTISIYSSEDGKNWTKEATNVDLTNKTAAANLNHMTYFALMAERLDTTPPITAADLSGDRGKNNWFRSDVNLSLDAKDNERGLGTDYTLYKKEGEDWEAYLGPLKFTNEGHYKVEFYSVDKDENIETFKTIEFSIDKTPPTVSANPERSPDHNDWYNHSLNISFTGTDELSGIDTCTSITYSEPNNNNASVEGECVDNAGNVISTVYNFKYDGTPPKPTLIPNPNMIWSPNNNLIDVVINGDADEDNVAALLFSVEDEYKLIQPKIQNFGDTIKLEARREGSDLDGRVYIIKVVVKDLAGNKGEAQTQVLVPHDKRNSTNQSIPRESTASGQEATESASKNK